MTPVVERLRADPAETPDDGRVSASNVRGASTLAAWSGDAITLTDPEATGEAALEVSDGARLTLRLSRTETPARWYRASHPLLRCEVVVDGRATFAFAATATDDLLDGLPWLDGDGERVALDGLLELVDALRWRGANVASWSEDATERPRAPGPRRAVSRTARFELRTRGRAFAWTLVAVLAVASAVAWLEAPLAPWETFDPDATYEAIVVSVYGDASGRMLLGADGEWTASEPTSDDSYEYTVYIEEAEGVPEAWTTHRFTVTEHDVAGALPSYRIAEPVEVDVAMTSGGKRLTRLGDLHRTSAGWPWIAALLASGFAGALLWRTRRGRVTTVARGDVVRVDVRGAGGPNEFQNPPSVELRWTLPDGTEHSETRHLPGVEFHGEVVFYRDGRSLKRWEHTPTVRVQTDGAVDASLSLGAIYRGLVILIWGGFVAIGVMVVLV